MGTRRWAEAAPSIGKRRKPNGPLKRRDWRQINVDSTGKIADPEAVTRQLVDENGHAIEYRDQRQAVAAIKAAAGIG